MEVFSVDDLKLGPQGDVFSVDSISRRQPRKPVRISDEVRPEFQGLLTDTRGVEERAGQAAETVGSGLIDTAKMTAAGLTGGLSLIVPALRPNLSGGAAGGAVGSLIEGAAKLPDRKPQSIQTILEQAQTSGELGLAAKELASRLAGAKQVDPDPEEIVALKEQFPPKVLDSDLLTTSYDYSDYERALKGLRGKQPMQDVHGHGISSQLQLAGKLVQEKGGWDSMSPDDRARFAQLVNFGLGETSLPEHSTSDLEGAGAAALQSAVEGATSVPGLGPARLLNDPEARRLYEEVRTKNAREHPVASFLGGAGGAAVNPAMRPGGAVVGKAVAPVVGETAPLVRASRGGVGRAIGSLQNSAIENAAFALPATLLDQILNGEVDFKEAIKETARQTAAGVGFHATAGPVIGKITGEGKEAERRALIQRKLGDFEQMEKLGKEAGLSTEEIGKTVYQALEEKTTAADLAALKKDSASIQAHRDFTEKLNKWQELAFNLEGMAADTTINRGGGTNLIEQRPTVFPREGESQDAYMKRFVDNVMGRETDDRSRIERMIDEGQSGDLSYKVSDPERSIQIAQRMNEIYAAAEKIRESRKAEVMTGGEAHDQLNHLSREGMLLQREMVEILDRSGDKPEDVYSVLQQMREAEATQMNSDVPEMPAEKKIPPHQPKIDAIAPEETPFSRRQVKPKDWLAGLSSQDLVNLASKFAPDGNGGDLLRHDVLKLLAYERHVIEDPGAASWLQKDYLTLKRELEASGYDAEDRARILNEIRSEIGDQIQAATQLPDEFTQIGSDQPDMDVINQDIASQIGFGPSKKPPSGSHQGGFVDFSPIIDGAIATGKWTATHTAIAADWMIRNAKDSLNNIGKFFTALKTRFGEGIMPKARQLWNFVKTRVAEEVAKSQKNSIGAVGNLAVVRAAGRKKVLGGDVIQQAAIPAFSEPLVDRVERLGEGHPVSNDATQRLRRVFDNEKVLSSQFAPEIDPALKIVSKPGKLTYALAKPEVKGSGDWAIRGLVEMVEGKKVPPPGTAPLLDQVKKANEAIAKIYQQVDPTFKPQGKIQNLATPEMIDFIRHPGSKGWDVMVKAFAEANGKTFAETETHFQDLNRELSSGDYSGLLRKINQEFRRIFPVHPSMIKVNKQWVDLYHHNPYDYFTIATRKVAARSAFIKEFGRGDVFTDYAATVRQVNGDVAKAFDDTVKAIHGVPLDNPGAGLSQALGTFDKYVGRPIAGLGLTASAPNQLIEAIFGNASAFYGFRNTIAGLRRLFKSGEVDKLEMQGKLAKTFYDLSWDPASPARNVSKYITTGSAFVNQIASHFQDNSAAATAQTYFEQVQKGGLSNRQMNLARENLIQLGFSKTDAFDMSRGKGTQEQYDRAIRQVMPQNTSGNRSPGQTTAITGSRLWNTMFKYMSYPAMQMNTIARSFRGVIDAAQSGDRGRVLAATELFGRLALNTLIRGAATSLFTAAITGGRFGFNMAVNKAEDEPGRFLLDAAAFAVGGPYMIAYRAANNYQRSANATEAVARSSQPVSVVLDLLDYANGKGQYADKTSFDKAVTFVNQRIPISRAITSWVAVDGLGEKNVQLDTAIRGLNQWKRNQGLSPGEPSTDPERTNFRTTMRRAAEMIRRGEDPSTLIKKELDVSSNEPMNIASSLRGKKVLETLDAEQKQALRKNLGDPAYEVLQNYDDLLEAWAEQYQVVERLGKTLGSKDALEFLEPADLNLISTRKEIATSKRELKESVNEVRRGFRDGTFTPASASGTRGQPAR